MAPVPLPSNTLASNSSLAENYDSKIFDGAERTQNFDFRLPSNKALVICIKLSATLKGVD